MSICFKSTIQSLLAGKWHTMAAELDVRPRVSGCCHQFDA